AEDGIRDLYVTGVQTCALPISLTPVRTAPRRGWAGLAAALVAVLLAACTSGPPPRVETPQPPTGTLGGHLDQANWADVTGWTTEIGRASCRERGGDAGVVESVG